MSVMKNRNDRGTGGFCLRYSLRAKRPSTGFISVSRSVFLIFWFCMDQMVHLVGRVEALSRYLKGSETYILYLVKAVGITYLCNFSSLVCKDAGFGAVAGQIEVFGKNLRACDGTSGVGNGD